MAARRIPTPLAPPSFALATLRGLLPLCIGIAIAWTLQQYIGPWSGPFRTKLLIDIGINVILAVSLNIVNGYTGQFSLGHAGFMAIGGYTAGIVTYYGSMRLWGSPLVHGGMLGSGDMLFVGGCLLGGFIAALAGYIVGVSSLRLRGDYLAIVTLGFAEILRVLLQRSGDVIGDPAEVAQTSWSDLITHVGGSLGFTGLAFYTNLFWIYIFVAMTVIVAYRLKMSSYGRAFLSIREDEIAAEALGVPVFQYKVRAFVIAAFFAGIAGGLFAHEVGTTLNPRELGFMKSIEIVIMVVLGGMGSVSGAIFAAIALTLLPELLRQFAEWRMIIYALSLILIMILRPQGIFGIHEIWDWKLFQRFKPGERNVDLNETLLDVQNVSISFGGLKAVADFSLQLRRGELQGLIGPNGAGKTTLFNLLTGVYQPNHGHILLQSKRLNGLKPHLIAKAGISRTFQNIRLFQHLSVLNNVRVAFHMRRSHRFVGAMLRSSAHMVEERTIKQRAFELLERVNLDSRACDLAKTLSYGDQRRLEIVRALANDPTILLLDEPAAGLNTHEKLDLIALIRRLREDFKLTILLIEHDMGVVMDLCERLTVLDYGVIIARGTPREVQRDPKVIEAYLGKPCERNDDGAA